MRKNLVRVGAVVAGLALLAAACGDDDDNGGGGATTTAGGDATTTTAGETTTTEGGATTTSGGATGEGLKIGALLPETGALSAIVQSLRVPIDIAVEEINDAGGVLGQEVTVVGADDGTNGDVLIPSVDRLIESDRVNVIVGPAPSGAAANIIDKIKSGQVPVCSGSTTSAELSTVDSGGFFFRTAPPDRLQGPALAELVLRDGHTRVGIIVRNDTYGVGLGDAIEDAITKTIAGFLNCDGGTLLIGIGPDREPLGLAHDYPHVRPQNGDGFVNWLTTHLINALGHTPVTRTRARITAYKGHDICRVDVAASTTPVWARTSTAERTFFVRMNNSTRALPDDEVESYWSATRGSANG